jgi:hypothetical protein
MINLETILLQEIKLWAILQFFRDTSTHLIQEWPSPSLMVLLEDWWNLTKDSACLFDLYKIYKDSQTRKILRKAMILESTLIVLSAFFNQVLSHPLYTNHDEDLLRWQVRCLTKLYHSVHQSMLHIICLVLQRMGLENCDTNLWAVNLKDVIATKIDLKVPTEALLMEETERNELIQQRCCHVLKIVRALAGKSEQRKCEGQQQYLFAAI